MTDQLQEIGARLGALRDVFDISVENMAQKMKISVDEYSAYERGQKDFSFSFLQNAAQVFNVDVVDIISGESPKLTKCALVRNGQGFDIERRKAYDYKHLAFTFSNKKAEPFMVTVEPKPGEKPVLHSHEGQEFDYMLSGKMEFYFDDIIYGLNEGDSVYFDSSVPHAMKAIGGQPAKFLAVVIK
jgi:quercetin dioxygenase-like cupin family protein/DNA-binding XRE family transcriptional regulator